VDLLESTTVADLVRSDGRVVGARLRTPDGERTVGARCLVGADGRNSAIARAVRAAEQASEAAHRPLYYRYVRGWIRPTGGVPDAAESHFAPDECAYVFPSDGGLTCLALSVNADTYAWLRQSPEARFAARLASYPGLAERVATACWEGRLLGSGPTRNYV